MIIKTCLLFILINLSNANYEGPDLELENSDDEGMMKKADARIRMLRSDASKNILPNYEVPDLELDNIEDEGKMKRADGRIRVLRLDASKNILPKTGYNYDEAIRMIRNQLIGKRVTRKLTSGGMFIKKAYPLTNW